MTRDNCVLVLKLQVKGRRIWVVAHVQAHEMFDDPEWTRRWLYAHPSRYTTHKRLALHIARKMADGIQRLEHGVVQMYSAAPIDDCNLKDGELQFPNL